MIKNPKIKIPNLANPKPLSKPKIKITDLEFVSYGFLCLSLFVFELSHLKNSRFIWICSNAVEHEGINQVEHEAPLQCPLGCRCSTHIPKLQHN